MTSRLSQQPEIPLDYDHDFTFHLLTDTGTDLTLVLNYTMYIAPFSYINMTSIMGPRPFDGYGAISPSEAIILSDTSTITRSADADPLVYRAFQCTLYLCMRVYDGSVQDGKLLEIVSSVVSTGWNSEFTGTGEARGLSGASLGNTLPDGQPARVSVDLLTFEHPAAYLGSNVNGPFTGGGLSGFQGFIQWTNDIVHGIWVNDPENVVQSWENIADSMTANMHVQSGNRVVGTATRPNHTSTRDEDSCCFQLRWCC